MQELSSSVEIIYEEKAGYLYLLAPNKITYAELSQDGIKERVQVDTLLQADYEYLPADNILVYINADGTLCYSEKERKAGLHPASRQEHSAVWTIHRTVLLISKTVCSIIVHR